MWLEGPWPNGVGLCFCGLNTQCAELDWASRRSDPSDPGWCFSRARGAQPGGTWWQHLAAFQLQKGGGRSPAERWQNWAASLSWGGSSQQEELHTTHCQNWEPPKHDRAETCFQPIAPAETQPVGKGTGGQQQTLLSYKLPASPSMMVCF